MKMRDSLMEVYNKLIKDEELLRLLYYTNKEVYDYSNINDPKHPLNPSRDNILDKTDAEKWEIIYDLIKMTYTVDGLDVNKKNRVCIYSGRRTPDGQRSYLVSKQSIFLDIYTPPVFDNSDFRMSWIVDRINELLFNDELESGVSNLGFKDGGKIETPDFGYNGYRLMYHFVDIN